MSAVSRALAALALAVTSLVVLGATATPAWACRCVPADTAQHVEAAEAVFSGTITARDESGGLTGEVVYSVAVDRVYKGDVEAEVTVATSSQETACGLPDLPQGEPLLFFGSADAVGIDRGDGVASDADWHANSCNGTGGTDDDELTEVEQVTGGSTAPDGASGAGDDDGVSPWLVGGFGIGALVLAVLVGVLLRRKRA